MSPSSDSLSSTSLPFGADTHTHATWRRSGSVPRSVQHEYQPAVYDLGPQTYSAFIADAQASGAVTRLPNARIPPTSIESIPRSHKKVLRQHRILFWILIGIFSISLIASTAAIVLGAIKAHQHGENGAKCAAIIVGVFGFSGMVGSAAVIWLILTGRKERSRLEKRWAEEERVKEARSVREREKESYVRESIRDRERSLSRSRSRGRDSDRVTRPAVTNTPSVRAMTPTPASQMPDHNTQPVSKRARSPWPSPVEFSGDIDDDPDDAIQENEKEIKIEKNSNYNDNSDSDEKSSGQDEKVASQASQKLRDSASTYFQDLDPSDSENEDSNNNNNNNEADIAVLEQEILSKLSLPLNDSIPFTPLPDPNHTSPIPPHTNSTHTHSSPTDPHTHHPTSPKPYGPPQLPPVVSQTPSSTAIQPPPDSEPPLPPPPTIPRLQHGLQGSVQSDDNFLAMLDLAEDAGSEDEAERRRRRQRGKERVEAWASAVEESEEMEDEGWGERKERGRRLREAVERGMRRVAVRKKERRLGGAVVGA
ncbi:MAG: hypothetical protein ALECFALPRED_002582 [Alectoria fallacina]|uniref:Uncharacterized protein n=1 Tax=Alectoria fallacina TaxID=1903189 RepID=A0A8H3FEY4_9LECA|nr:MAG: hypothetical protein ALECFALPRED_002582 [Alectoria fallacina]